MNIDDKIFWQVNEQHGGGTIVNIDTIALRTFLQNSGFAKYYHRKNKKSIYVRVHDNILSECSDEQIKDFVFDYVRNLSEIEVKPNIKKELDRQLTDKSGSLLSGKLFSTLEVFNKEIIKDGKDFAFIPFINGVAKIDKSRIEVIEYKNLNFCIWKDQIIQHEFIPSNDISDFGRFIMNVTKHDNERFKALLSAIGFLIHGYKDPSNTKAVIFCDEVNVSSDRHEGRTGKSLVGKAISLIRDTLIIDGKLFNPKERFAFQQVTYSTQVINLNDVRKEFNIESLFSVISEGLHVEKKNRDSITIPFADSPKILITTNHTVLGKGGSFEDRMFEIEFSNFYNINHKPKDDFKKNFFDDWNEDEWNRFYNFMINSLRMFLSTGLIPYEHINLQRRKLIQEYGESFMKYISNIKLGIEYDKSVLYNNFIEEYGELYSGKQRTFTEKISSYAEEIGWNVSTRKSNNLCYIKFDKKLEKSD